MQRVIKSVQVRWRSSPTLVRAVPFFVFVGLTFFQGRLGEASRYWIYALKTIVGAGLIWAIWGWIEEMRWRWSADAVVMGVVVFAMWVGLDGWYPSIDALPKLILRPVAGPLGLSHWCATASAPAAPWNPHHQFGPPLAWMFVLIRLVGSTLVVPPLEEVFYRSFLYRYLIRPDFWTEPLNALRWGPLFVAATIFGCSHYEWLAGILCGLLYQGLVFRHNRLGDAMTAHAITNFLLGIWIITRGAWHFW
jgi:membrane protease YdiL (CAAX protease family)